MSALGKSRGTPAALKLCSSSASASTLAVPATPPPPLVPEILDHLPIMVWCTDSDGRCISTNREALRFCGRTWPELEGDGWLQVLHPEDQERVRATFRGSPSLAEGLEIESRMQQHDGTYRWASIRARPMRDSGGAVTSYIGTAVDIHEQREVAHDHRRTEELVQFLSHATRELIWTWDVRAGQIATSPAVTAVFGEIPHALQEAYVWWNSRVHPDDRARVISSLEGAFLLDSTALVWSTGSAIGTAWNG